MQASAKSDGSEIFVLDMGEQIRIVDLAETMIRLAGKVPYEDIDIEFTGLRPGEKLMEEIYRDNSEGMLATYHGQDAYHARAVSELGHNRRAGSTKLRSSSPPGRELEIIPHIQRLVPEYKPATRYARNSAKEALPESASNGPLVPLVSRDRRDNGSSEKNGKSSRAAVAEQFVPPVAYEQ